MNEGLGLPISARCVGGGGGGFPTTSCPVRAECMHNMSPVELRQLTTLRACWKAMSSSDHMVVQPVLGVAL